MNGVRFSAIVAAVTAFVAACGDVEGNVIVRTATSSDGGGQHECRASSDCQSPKPLCEPRSLTCVECLSANDCQNPTKLLCNQATRTCAECIVNSDCTDPREQCAAPLNRCAAPCASDSDCLPDDPHCDLAIGFCVGCTRALIDCTDPSRPYCVEGDCVSCPNGQC
jgi:hypothetical protein